MLDKNFSETDQLNCLLHFIVENSIVYYFVWDELNRIISVELLLPNSQKSLWRPSVHYMPKQYYFGVIFFCLKRYRFLYKQFKFLNKPKEKQTVERQLLIVAQYFVPHVPYSVINTWLDGITQEVLSRLKHKYPMHSIFSIPLEFSFWGDNNISKNFWNPTEASQIISIVGEYIFSDLKTHKLCELLMIPNLEVELNKRSIPVPYHRIIVTIIYYIATRRFGIKDFILNVKILNSLEQRNPLIGFCHHIGLDYIWKAKYKIHRNVYEDFRMQEESDLRLSITDDTYHIGPSHTFDYLGQNKLNFSISFDLPMSDPFGY